MQVFFCTSRNEMFTFVIEIKQKITCTLTQPHGATFINIETLALVSYHMEAETRCKFFFKNVL